MSTSGERVMPVTFEPYVPVMERNHLPTAQTEMMRLLDECARLGKENSILREERDMLERRVRMVAGSNADDWRWYQNAAKQAVRALDGRRR